MAGGFKYFLLSTLFGGQKQHVELVIFAVSRLTAATYNHHQFRKDKDLNRTSRGIMFHVNLAVVDSGHVWANIMA